MTAPLASDPPLYLEDDVALAAFARNNPAYSIERNADGSISLSPTHTRGGARSGEAFGQLREYAKRVGGRSYDANTGFAIGPGKTVRSPDAAWLSRARIDEIKAQGLDRGYWPVSPDIAVEVRSDTDDFRDTVAHAQAFVERGSAYSIAIDPVTRAVVTFGVCPSDLQLDIDAIIDAE